ncbi:MAG: hypothetical protein FH749_03335 [Firmicutes bacterium]|nr:hypothetical protein [Bacillota bacterium]
MRFADFHCDTVLKLYNHQLQFADTDKQTHLDLKRLKQNDFILQSFAIFCDPLWGQESVLRNTLRMLNLAREQVFQEVNLVTAGEQLEDNGLSGILTIEGADFIGDDLFLIDLVHNLGVRLITLTWNHRNTLADGVGVRATAGGLTQLGRAAIQRMQNLNIIVDVSHLAEKGFWDVCKYSTRPIVASHSNSQRLCAHPRNLSDAQIREIGQNKGLIGVNMSRPFIADTENRQDLEHLVQHMVVLSEIAGVETVCLGLDLDGIPALPNGADDVSSVQLLPDLMEQAGFDKREIEAICYRNLCRFIKTYLG